MKVKFENIRHGWVDFTISDGEENIVSDSFSYTPYDSFDDLISAIDSFRKEYQSNEERIVILHVEPYEYELIFNGTNENVNLTITGYPDYKRGENRGQEIYEISGNFEEICVPFWRGLRSLQGLHSAKELDELWHRGFPSSALDILSSKIQNHERKKTTNKAI
ncbi:hypothetical protein NBRC116494_12110 [Aurantivibrio plasticivorans]